MTIDAFGFALDVSPRAYFDKENDRMATSPPMPIMAMQEFKKAADGQLEHWIDGRLRATIPPEAWDDYAEMWPNAADFISGLRI